MSSNPSHNPRLSVVVPIYNAQDSLSQCLAGLANQTLPPEALQLVLVDDGSTDDSVKIVDDFVRQHANAVCWHIPNQGLSHARQFGIAHAEGEYVGFCDADDLCLPDMYQTLLALCEENDLDVAACRYWCQRRGQDRMPNTTISSYDDRVLESPKEVFDQVIRNIIIDGNEPVVVWNKVYKRALFDDDEIDYGQSPLEDYMLNMQILRHTRRFYQSSQPFYVYYLSDNSLSHVFNSKTFSVLLKADAVKHRLFADELEEDEELRLKAALWFLKYLKNILKTLFYDKVPNTLDRRQYARQMLESPEAQFYAQLLAESPLGKLLAGPQWSWIQDVHRGRENKIIWQIKAWAWAKRIVRTLQSLR